MEIPIELQTDLHFMNEALRLAGKAFAKEEVPVGAVVVRDGKIIARAYNQVELLKDATAHAEMLAITQAEAAVGDWRLERLRSLRDERALRDVRGRLSARPHATGDFWLSGPTKRGGGWND